MIEDTTIWEVRHGAIGSTIKYQKFTCNDGKVVETWNYYIRMYHEDKDWGALSHGKYYDSEEEAKVELKKELQRLIERDEFVVNQLKGYLSAL